MEVVEGAEVLEKELRNPDEVLGSRLNSDPGLRAIGVVGPEPTGTRHGSGRSGRYRISTT
jgi:hypothetical protein